MVTIFVLLMVKKSLPVFEKDNFDGSGQACELKF